MTNSNTTANQTQVHTQAWCYREQWEVRMAPIGFYLTLGTFGGNDQGYEF